MQPVRLPMALCTAQSMPEAWGRSYALEEGTMIGKPGLESQRGTRNQDVAYGAETKGVT